MRNVKKSEKGMIAILLVLVLVVSAFACALVVNAEDTGESLAVQGADNYYFWGINSNDPDFGAMTSPTGSFSYDGTKGYYYYDLNGASGDYCFVVSKVNSSGAAAVKSPAVGGVANSGKYYLQQGNYHGYACMHLWNPSGEAIRIYFTSEGAGLNAIAQSEAGQTPTVKPTSATTPVTPTTKPTTPVTPTTKPTTPVTPTTPSGTRVVYCENAAGWSVVTAYMWNDGNDSNAGWPGVKMTNVGNNIWQYNIPKNYANIIFSESGNNQTTDLTFPGSGYIYNNKTGAWSVYDTSPLQVQSFTTDLQSPQYNEVAITLSARATGQGTVSYKFSATNNSTNSTVVIADYSANNSAIWVPKATGTYTLTYEFKDTSGNTNKRTLSYQITDGLSSTAPYIKQVTPAPGQIKKSVACNVTVSAGGGVTGTKLLFYKYTVKDSSGKIVNVPYYTRNTSYSFTPAALGTYTVEVSVQGSDNTTVIREYVYTSVNDITAPTTPAVTPTNPAGGGTENIGDADNDGAVTILDATRIQRFLADLIRESDLNKANADADRDGSITILDATRIQRFLADLISSL